MSQYWHGNKIPTLYFQAVFIINPVIISMVANLPFPVFSMADSGIFEATDRMFPFAFGSGFPIRLFTFRTYVFSSLEFTCVEAFL